MGVYIYMYIYIYTQIYIYICLYIYICTHTYIYTYNIYDHIHISLEKWFGWLNGELAQCVVSVKFCLHLRCFCNVLPNIHPTGSLRQSQLAFRTKNKVLLSVLLPSFHGRLLSKGHILGVGSGYICLPHQTADFRTSPGSPELFSRHLIFPHTNL